jgi:hypothetical protein
MGNRMRIIEKQIDRVDRFIFGPPNPDELRSMFREAKFKYLHLIKKYKIQGKIHLVHTIEQKLKEVEQMERKLDESVASEIQVDLRNRFFDWLQDQNEFIKEKLEGQQFLDHHMDELGDVNSTINEFTGLKEDEEEREVEMVLNNLPPPPGDPIRHEWKQQQQQEEEEVFISL